MSSNEQRRESAKRKLERQVERRAERERKRKQRATVLTAVGAVIVVLGGIGIYALVSGSGDEQAAPPPPAAAAGLCEYQPEGDPARPVTAPDPNPPQTGTVDLTLNTNEGAIPMTLDRSSAACAVNAVTSLAQQQFYDDTPCPRLVTGEGLQVLQCGDPTGTGSGGPGFRYAEEPPQGLEPSPLAPGQASNYPRGVVAMAKASAPNTTGSQFFLVYGDSALPPEYSVLGTIAEPGLQVLDRIAAGGDDGSNPAGGGAPAIPVQIEQAVVAAPAP